MSSRKIGIKIANRTFYPIMDEDSPGRKRLTLTTVRDNQENVQIDLYRGEGDSLENARYIGSLVVESIQASAKGEPEISLDLDLDADGNVRATAADSATGERQSLSVALETIDQDEAAVPDFDLDDLSMEDLDDFEIDEPVDQPASDETTVDEEISDEEVSDEEISEEEISEEAAADENLFADVETPDLGESLEEPRGESDQNADLAEELSLEGLDFDEDDLDFEGSEPTADTDIGTEPNAASEQAPVGEASVEVPSTDETTPSPDELSLEEDFELGEELSPDQELSIDYDEQSAEEQSAEEQSAEDDLLMRGLDATDEDESEADDLLADELSDELELEEGASGDESVFDIEAAADEEPADTDDLSLDDFEFDDLGGEEDDSEVVEEADVDFGDVDLDSDFDFGDEAEVPADVATEPEPTADSELEPAAAPTERPEDDSGSAPEIAPRRGNNLVMVGFVVLALAALSVLVYFIYQLLSGDPAPPLEASLPLLFLRRSLPSLHSPRRLERSPLRPRRR